MGECGRAAVSRDGVHVWQPPTPQYWLVGVQCVYRSPVRNIHIQCDACNAAMWNGEKASFPTHTFSLKQMASHPVKTRVRCP